MQKEWGEMHVRIHQPAWSGFPATGYMVSCYVTSMTYGGAEKATISPHGVCC